MQSGTVGIAFGMRPGVVPCSALSAALVIVLTGTIAHAAEVRDLKVFAAASATRIIVEVDGDFRYRTHASPDGGSILIDIEDATIGEDAPRMLPVSDRRVDGVIVLGDAEARIVRVAVDIAGKEAPGLDASADGSRLILTFVDAGATPPMASPDSANSSDGSKRSDPTPPPGSLAPASREQDRAARAAALRRIAAIEARAGGSAQEPLEASASRPPAASRRSVARKPIVVLDPGHGGKDPGAKAWTGEFEKDIVLDLADRVARRLRGSGQVEVVMTRSGDEYVSLADRRDTSQRWNAAAFVSIHANASGSATARGIETYYHSRTTGAGSQGGDRAARRLARVENDGKPAKGRAGSASARRASLPGTSAPVLDRRSESMRLAGLVQGELVRRLEMRYEAVRDLGAKEGPFFVIGGNAAPSVLVEAAFLTHREEGVRMRSEVYREQIADGVARGILAFLDEERKSGTL